MSTHQPRVAIIDTNILDYSFKSRTKEVAARLLETLSPTYTLTISEYLRFEIYRGLKAEQVPAAKAVVDGFEAYPVSKRVLDISAALMTCYGKDEQTRDRMKSYADGDVILAATAFAYKFVVITANRADFPAPYFTEAKIHKYIDKQEKPWVFYELEPDIEYLNGMLDICYPSKVSQN